MLHYEITSSTQPANRVNHPHPCNRLEHTAMATVCSDDYTITVNDNAGVVRPFGRYDIHAITTYERSARSRHTVDGRRTMANGTDDRMCVQGRHANGVTGCGHVILRVGVSMQNCQQRVRCVNANKDSGDSEKSLKSQ